MPTTSRGVWYPGEAETFPPGFFGTGGWFEQMAESIDDVLPRTAQGRVDTTETTTSTVFADLATLGPDATIVIGPSGTVLLTVAALLSNNTAGVDSLVAFATVSGSITANANQALRNRGTDRVRASVTTRLVGLTPGATVTFRAKYKVDGGTGTFVHRELSVVTF